MWLRQLLPWQCLLRLSESLLEHIYGDCDLFKLVFEIAYLRLENSNRRGR